MREWTGPQFLSLEPLAANRVAGRWVGGLVANMVLVGVLGWFGSGGVEPGEKPKRRMVSLVLPANRVAPVEVAVRPLPRPAIKRAVIPEVARVKPLADMDLPAPPIVAPTQAVVAPVVPVMVPHLPKREMPVVVGAFGSPQPVQTVAMKQQQAVLNTSFESQASPAVATKTRSVVESTQFGGMEVAVNRPRRDAGMIADSGFGGLQTAGTAKREVRVESGAGFDAPLVARTSAKAAAIEGDLKPVEILVKPKPMYTEAARQLGIEGEVALRIQFGADGKLKVLSVVKGLGHGLDENAAIAASMIQFRPALRGGRPVEQVAVLRVQFQLVR